MRWAAAHSDIESDCHAKADLARRARRFVSRCGADCLSRASDRANDRARSSARAQQASNVRAREFVIRWCHTRDAPPPTRRGAAQASRNRSKHAAGGTNDSSVTTQSSVSMASSDRKRAPPHAHIRRRSRVFPVQWLDYEWTSATYAGERVDLARAPRATYATCERLSSSAKRHDANVRSRARRAQIKRRGPSAEAFKRRQRPRLTPRRPRRPSRSQLTGCDDH